MDDVTCEKPGGNMRSAVNSQWMPYTSPSKTCIPVPGYIEEVNRQRALLCEIMVPLGYYL